MTTVIHNGHAEKTVTQRSAKKDFFEGNQKKRVAGIYL